MNDPQIGSRQSQVTQELEKANMALKGLNEAVDKINDRLETALRSVQPRNIAEAEKPEQEFVPLAEAIHGIRCTITTQAQRLADTTTRLEL